MAEFKEIKPLISDTRPDERGSEGVYAIIRNDFAKDATGNPFYNKEFSYKMEGFFLHAPIPKDTRGGFKTAEEAEVAAREELKEWRSGNIPPNTKVTQQEYWQMKYYSDPYLQHLTSEEINQRFADISNNLLTLTEKRQIGFVPMDISGDYLSASYAHLICETGLRGGLQGSWKELLSYPDYDWVGIDKVSKTVEKLNLKEGEFLVKLGKEEYMKSAFEKGEIRIAPAGSYDDPSLNRAIRDDELNLSIRPRPQATKIKHLNEYAKDLKNPVEPIGTRVETLTSPTNYYVYCMASDFSLRLFPDFEADACLIITKPQIFIERLLAGVLKQLDGWNGFGTGVKYIDPVNTTKEEIDIFYTKNFKYLYQKEYRLVWTPPNPVKDLDFIFVSLGSLSDCCELISLKEFN